MSCSAYPSNTCNCLVLMEWYWMSRTSTVIACNGVRDTGYKNFKHDNISKKNTNKRHPIACSMRMRYGVFFANSMADLLAKPNWYDSSAIALKLHLFCIKPSRYGLSFFQFKGWYICYICHCCNLCNSTLSLPLERQEQLTLKHMTTSSKLSPFPAPTDA